MQVLNLQTLNSRVDRNVPFMYLRGNFVLFNKTAAEMMGLQVHDKVEFHEDGIFGFYVIKTDDPMGFMIIKTSNNFGIANKLLCAHIREKCKVKAKDAVYFILKESPHTPQPYVKWELKFKAQKNG